MSQTVKLLLLTLSTFVVSAFPHSAYAQAKLPFSAELLALSGCDLRAASDNHPCSQVVLPIRAKLAVTTTSAKRRFSKIVSSDADGHLSVTLPKGRYSLRLTQVSTGGSTLVAKNLRVTPSRIRVTNRSAPTLLLVTHKTRTAPSISIGYNK